MKRISFLPFVITAAAGLMVVSGCSSNTKASIASDARSVGTDIASAAGNVKDNAAELLARNIATQQGEEQFKNAGSELNGPLTCTATTQDGASKIDISCTGTAKSGGKAELKGTTSEIPGASATQIEGQFVGTVDSKQVFTTDKLGG